MEIPVVSSYARCNKALKVDRVPWLRRIGVDQRCGARLRAEIHVKQGR